MSDLICIEPDLPVKRTFESAMHFHLIIEEKKCEKQNRRFVVSEFVKTCDELFYRLGNATLLYPLLWRFLPVIDVNVDFYLSRDLDSRISDREVGKINKKELVHF